MVPVGMCTHLKTDPYVPTPRSSMCSYSFSLVVPNLKGREAYLRSSK